MNIVLIEPEIPQNTGSIARVAAGTGAALHLVGTLGFSLDDRHLKRAGLDYWPHVILHRHATVADFRRDAWGPAGVPTGPARERVWLFSAHGARTYADVAFGPNDWLVFGRESTGLDPALRMEFADRCLQIPLNGLIRSLNLSNAVSIVLFEALRQRGFPHAEGIRT